MAPTRLNPTDATLWDIERNPALRTTIVAAMVLDRPVDPERLVELLEAASRRVPRFRQRVVANPGGVGPPHWELAADFDVHQHISFVDAQGVVDQAAIAAVAEPMASSPLDRERPLWECTYIGGATGPSAVVLKVHHSLTDGVGGIGMLDVILDRDRDAPAPDLSSIATPRPAARPGPSAGDVASTVARAVTLPVQAMSVAAKTAGHPLGSAQGAFRGARSAARLLAPTSAPLSPLMTGRGVDRRTGTSEHDLERLHRAAAVHGCTINQAFIAASVGGIAAYHRELGSPIDRLRVTMPVSLRRADHAAAGNQWAPVRFVVPTDIDDAVERMSAMRELVLTSRREPALSFSQSLAGLVQVLPSALSSGVVGGMMRGVDVTMTNVPGLTEPHYLGGASVERIFAFAPTAGASLNIGLVSHLGTACIGTLMDAAAVSEPELLTGLIADGVEELIRAAERTPPAPRPVGDHERSTLPAPESPERLSALDTGFLRLETAKTPIHIGAAFVLDGTSLRDDDGAIRIDDARRHVEARIQSVPRFTRRISEVPLGLGRPLWVDDEGFDISRHVRLTTVAPPGGRQELLDRCAELFTERLDRDHALWELWLIDGLADGRVGIVEKVHHALIDGVSGVELAAAVFDLTPDARADTPRPMQRAPGPSAFARLTGAVAEQLTDPLALARRTAATLWTAPEQLVDQAVGLAAAARDLTRQDALAPPTPFNREVGPRRALRAVTLDLASIDRIRGPLHATLNDVVLTTVAGALRRWFDAEGEAAVDVHVLVPVSTRHGAMQHEPGNRVGGVLVSLPVGEPDPVRRLQIVQHRMLRLKANHEGEGAALLLDALDHVPAIGYGVLSRLVAAQPLVNVVVTNVPGPRDPLSFLGATIEQMIPVVPLGPGLGLAIAALSYVDRLTVSLFADPDACADLDVLAAAVDDEFAALAAAVDGG